MPCSPPGTEHQTFVPVCASVICEAPGVIYVSIDPDVWKIRCRQCQEKTEHKCALKKLKNKFRGDPSKRRIPKSALDGDGEGGEGGRAGAGGKGDEDEEERRRKMRIRGKRLGDEDSIDLEPEEQIPDEYCACRDRPRNIPPKPYVCLCELYKPLNFMLELEVTGEFKPAHVPKTKKGKEQ